MGSVQKTWEKLTSTVLNEKVFCDFIDQQTEKIKESAELNYMKWDNIVKEKVLGDWEISEVSEMVVLEASEMVVSEVSVETMKYLKLQSAGLKTM